MFTVFIVIQVLLTIALVGLILVQRNDSDGLGSMGGGGGGNSFMTGRGAANFMTRSTAIIATLFMLNSLWLAIMASNISGRASLAELIESEDAATVNVPLADDVPATTPAITPVPTEDVDADAASASDSQAEQTSEKTAEDEGDAEATPLEAPATDTPTSNTTTP